MKTSAKPLTSIKRKKSLKPKLKALNSERGKVYGPIYHQTNKENLIYISEDDLTPSDMSQILSR